MSVQWARKTLSAALALTLVLVSLPISFTFDGGTYKEPSITVEENKAHAIAPVVAGAGAAFVEAVLATMEGVTAGELVAAVAGSLAVGFGMSFATDAGISMGNSGSVNLEHLIEAADYPDWDTLTAEQQNLWGSQENYNSAKFNELLSAFGLENAKDRYYQGFSGSSGDFDFEPDELERLEQLQRIATNWASGAGNTIGDILGSFSPNAQTVINNYVGGVSTQYFNGDNISDWPSSVPGLYVSIGNRYTAMFSRYEGSSYTSRLYSSNIDTYWIPLKYRASNGYEEINVFACSKTPFRYGQASGGSTYPTSATMNQTASYQSVNGHDVYYGSYSSNGAAFNYLVESSGTFNEVSSSISVSVLRDIAEKILYSDENNLGTNFVININNYPSNIQNDVTQNVYYPSQGVEPGSNWYNFVIPPENGSGSGGNCDHTLMEQILTSIDSKMQTANTTLGNIYTEIARIKAFLEDVYVSASHAIRVVGGSSGSVDLSNIEDILENLTFTTTGDLKMFDERVRATLGEILLILQNFGWSNGNLKVVDQSALTKLDTLHTDLQSILSAINGIASNLLNWYQGTDASELIGDVDFDEMQENAANLGETISSLLPFGSLLLLSEGLTLISESGQLQEPTFDIPFNFMPGENLTISVDLSWMDDARVYINFGLITMLVIGLLTTTARLLELEAAA